MPTSTDERDGELIEVEGQLRVAVRDAVNRASRKPFYWGGLKGYVQLEAVAQVLRTVPPQEPGTGYLQRLTMQVERALEKNRTLAQDVGQAHTWLLRIARCLRYPPTSHPPSETSETLLTSERVKQEMEELLRQFQPDLERRPAQAALYHAWHRVWKTCGTDLLPCYDIPGLPPDNLGLEALFGRLRRHTRRISGRKSTRELRDFGQYQVLFLADSEAELLEQLRQVPLAEYQARRLCLAQAEAPRQFLHRLHRHPLDTVRTLVNQHAARRTELMARTGLSPP